MILYLCKYPWFYVFPCKEKNVYYYFNNSFRMYYSLDHSYVIYVKIQLEKLVQLKSKTCFRHNKLNNSESFLNIRLFSFYSRLKKKFLCLVLKKAATSSISVLYTTLSFFFTILFLLKNCCKPNVLKQRKHF